MHPFLCILSSPITFQFSCPCSTFVSSQSNAGDFRRPLNVHFQSINYYDTTMQTATEVDLASFESHSCKWVSQGCIQRGTSNDQFGRFFWGSLDVESPVWSGDNKTGREAQGPKAMQSLSDNLHQRGCGSQCALTSGLVTIGFRHVSSLCFLGYLGLGSPLAALGDWERPRSGVRPLVRLSLSRSCAWAERSQGICVRTDVPVV